jgi:hypothetical protein
MKNLKVGPQVTFEGAKVIVKCTCGAEMEYNEPKIERSCKMWRWSCPECDNLANFMWKFKDGEWES